MLFSLSLDARQQKEGYIVLVCGLSRKEKERGGERI